MTLDDDLTQWAFWWEINKAPFLRLREAVLETGPQTNSDDHYLGNTRRRDNRDSLRPTDREVLEGILPELKKAIDSTAQRDINSACMVAMAKIGVDHPDFRLLDVFAQRLGRGDLELRETAALSIGIAAIAGEDEVRMLVDLALDRGRGRDACGKPVDNRTRSFATYGLGLLASRTTNTAIKRQAFETMRQLLDDDRLRDRNLAVAAINGMAILDIGTSTEVGRELLAEVLQSLESYYMQQLGAGRQLIQAHCPPAIAKLIGRDHERSEHYRRLFADDLLGKGRIERSGNEIPQSCALALGKLVRPFDDERADRCPDAAYSKLLLRTWREHKDAQTRNFAVLGLGLIGGAENRTALLREFDHAGKNQEKPWCALALGVHTHFAYEAQRQRGGDVAPDVLVGETLLAELRRAKDPQLVSALGIGLGLARATPAADHMRRLVLDNQPKEAMAGYLAVGLALMNDSRSIETLSRIMNQSQRRLLLLQQVAIALGKLGDKGVADELRSMLVDGEPNLAKLSAVASAIGFIGDRRTIRPLTELLFDERLGELSRAFAAVALGGIADKELLPWNTKIGVDMNYRAAVETLTDGRSGILDIL